MLSVLEQLLGWHRLDRQVFPNCLFRSICEFILLVPSMIKLFKVFRLLVFRLQKLALGY